MPRGWIALVAAIALVATVAAVGLFVWPGLPADRDDPYLAFRPALQSPGEVVALLGDPDAIDRNCWKYFDRGAVGEMQVCFGPKGRVAWSARSGPLSAASGDDAPSRVKAEPIYPGDPGQVVAFGEFALVRPQNWSSWTIYNGLKGPGLQIVSDEDRERTSPGEADPIKAMVGDQVALTLIPAGRLSNREDVLTIARDDLETEGAKVPRGRAIVDRLLCGGGACLHVAVMFARQQPSDGLIRQVNRLLATVQPAGS